MLLLDTKNEVNLSYFSIFEMIIKSTVGKLKYDQTLISGLQDAGVEVLWPDEATLNGYKIFNPENKDPFDNALITIAIASSLTLVTSDKNILRTKAPGLLTLSASL